MLLETYRIALRIGHNKPAKVSLNRQHPALEPKQCICFTGLPSSLPGDIKPGGRKQEGPAVRCAADGAAVNAAMNAAVTMLPAPVIPVLPAQTMSSTTAEGKVGIMALLCR